MASSMDTELLRKSIVLGSLPPAELERLIPTLKRRSFRRGETLYHQGDPGHVLHVLLDGHGAQISRFLGCWAACGCAGPE